MAGDRPPLVVWHPNPMAQNPVSNRNIQYSSGKNGLMKC